jgi:kelch-like protein 2/3
MDLLQQAGLPEDQQQDMAGGAEAEAGALVLDGGGGGAGLLHRSASVSSLDECSQRASDLRIAASLRSLGSSASSNRLQMIESKHRKIAGHPGRCLEGLYHLQRSDVLTDVTLVADNVEVRAHKNVLAANSPYFHAMFTENFEERLSKSVTLSEVDPQALEALVKFIYTAEVDISEDNVQALLTAANLLQLSEVRDACCEFLASQLHPTNCLGIRSFADLHGCTELLITSEK